MRCLACCSGCVGLVAVLMGCLFFWPPVAQFFLPALDALLDERQGGGPYNKFENRYLKGNFAPTSETDSPLALELVAGELPKDLQGMFLRVGPNPYIMPSPKRHHVFDGDGMIHSIRIKDGVAQYQNRYVETPRLKKEKELGVAWFGRIGELWGPIGLVKALLIMKPRQMLNEALFGMTQIDSVQANTAMALTPDGRVLALNEGGLPFRVDFKEDGSFTSRGFDRFDGQLDYAFSAHPKLDQVKEEMYFHGYSFGDTSTFLKVGRAGRDGKLLNYFPVNTSGPSFNHDMMLTKTRAVVMDFSVRFNPKEIAKGKGVFSFDPSHKARFGIFPRDASSDADVLWIEAPEALASVHPLHAWDDGDDEVVVWMPLGHAANTTGQNNVIEGCCTQWKMSEVRINLKAATVNYTIIDTEMHSEFSHLRSDLVAQDGVRYGYTGFMEESDFNFTGMAKWDMVEKKVAGVIRHAPGKVGGEPVFVGHGGPGSDEGFIAMFLIDQDGESEFVLYDAKTFSPTPVAILKVPKRVPYGFHAFWLAEDKLQQHLALAQEKGTSTV